MSLCPLYCCALLYAAAAGQGLPLLAAGGSAGVVALWNLEGRCLHHVIRDAHDRPLLGLHFFAGEPLLMSSAGDNSIKQWVSCVMLCCSIFVWCCVVTAVQ
jgi:WD40 repeat protein